MRLYKITNKNNGKLYIGITRCSLSTRWHRHVHSAKRRKNPSSPLQAAIRKHGRGAFTIVEIGRADSWAALCSMEITAIREYGTRAPAGYNLTDGGEPGPTVPSRHQLGKKMPPHVAAAIRAARVGSKATAETRAKMSTAHRGKKFSAATRAKVAAGKIGAANPQFGKPRTADERARIAAKLTGHKRSAEYCAALSAARQAKPTRAKLTPDDVRHIRRQHAAGLTGKAIAAEVGISQQTICDILRGRSWEHIT